VQNGVYHELCINKLTATPKPGKKFQKLY